LLTIVHCQAAPPASQGGRRNVTPRPCCTHCPHRPHTTVWPQPATRTVYGFVPRL